MKLFPFQEEAVNTAFKMLSKRNAVYNACEMGLGKSAQALALVKGMRRCANTLIICPAVVTSVWENEIGKWETAHGIVERYYKVVSYHKASQEKILKELTHDWDFLILDEAHYLKNPKAKRTKAILKNLWPKAQYKICLSGTPFTQSIMDCWPIFSLIAPEFFSDYWAFAHTYCNVIHNGYGVTFNGVKNASKLSKFIRNNFFIRYKKEDVLKDLPAKNWQKIPLPKEFGLVLSAEETKAMEDYIKVLDSALSQNKPAAIPVAVSATRQEQGLKKVKPILDFVKDLLDQEIPVVLFGYHRSVLEKLEEGLKDFKPIVITGDVSQAKRAQYVKEFQDGNTNLFIGQIQAAGVGITLTRSSTVVFAELTWTPAEISQAVDRVHRIGQANSVNAYYFVVEDSIDERIIDVVMEKAISFRSVIG